MGELGRRDVLRGIGGLAVAAPIIGGTRSAAALVSTPDAVGAPAPEQLHLQFGADAGREVAVSWAAAQRVAKPVLRLGQPGHGHGTEIPAEEHVYTDTLTGQTVFTYHAAASHLHPDHHYEYAVTHRGGSQLGGTFRTAPEGRSKGFRFTSFGDQAIPAKVGKGLGPATPNAGYIVDAVERLDPLFHLLNGDLCYANVSDAPVETWQAFFNNNQRSARNRPWMPAAGNHENEVGNGPDGYLSYQTRFKLPGNGSHEFTGHCTPSPSGRSGSSPSTTTTCACRTAGSARTAATTSRTTRPKVTTPTSAVTAGASRSGGSSRSCAPPTTTRGSTGS
jgi:Purple acid Phosphatase, N-terminal domain/Calcineurin-like phosphoesterase